ncbi:hypothetical protein H8E88_11780 [candidate division KSB1 bacterium]|nr:hypothetical protein [candidate division KSB1 bacterium]MBL7092849.1 hypothetical protein [candidate division KSB1 bacterium]
MLDLYQRIADIAQKSFNDVVNSADFLGGTPANPDKVRILIKDGSFLDIWLSEEGDYSYHWERRRQSGEIFRWDNAPHHPQINTYPDHFHKYTERNVVSSKLSSNFDLAVPEVLEFIREYLSKNK